MAQVVDDIRRNERFIALDVDDDIGIGKMSHSLGQTVGPIGMVFPGHDSPAAKRNDRIIDLGIVDGDDDSRQFRGLGRLFIHALYHRFAGNIT